MSKYNLTDILEQYRIGSGWTTDFDYDGMLKTGLSTSIDTPIEVLKKMSDDFEDVNYHRENNHLQYAIDAIEIGDMMEAEGKISDFHAEIRKTMESFNMDMSDDLGAYMASKMDLDEDKASVDLAIEASQEKAGIKEDKEMDEIAGYDRKGNKQEDSDGSDASKYKRAAMNKEDLRETIGNAKAKIDEGSYPFDQCLSDNEGKYGKKGAAKVCGYIKAQYGEGIVKEVRIDRDVAERIEGMLSIPLKRKFLDAFMDLWQDLIEEDPFYAEDVINHLNNEMHREIDGFQAQGDRLAGIEEALPKFKGVPPKRDIRTALKQDAKGTDAEIDQYFTSLVKAGDEFDEMEDYVEDFKNYVADKSLQEHFKRFM